MSALKYVNLAAPVLLTDPISDTATVLTVGSTSSFPDPPFLLGIDRGTVDEEVVLCTAKTATTFTVTRGYDGTTGVAHDVGALVEHTTTAIVHRRAGIAQVTTAERDALSGEDLWDGRTVWNTSTSKLQYWTGTVWSNVGPRSGAIEAFAGASAPPGTFLCQGQAVSRTTYADLFAAIGETFGSGDGSTTFNVPDLRQRFPVGAQAGGDYDLGDTGGAAEVTLTTAQIPVHTHTGPPHTHSIPSHAHSMPSHSHGSGSLSTGSAGAHDHGVSSQSAEEGVHGHLGSPGRISRSISDGGGFQTDTATTTNGNHTHSISGSTSSVDPGNTNSGGSGTTGSSGTGNTGSAGSGQAHENRPPFLSVNFIIYM